MNGFNIADEALTPSVRKQRGWLKCQVVFILSQQCGRKDMRHEILKYFKDACFDPFRQDVLKFV